MHQRVSLVAKRLLLTETMRRQRARRTRQHGVSPGLQSEALQPSRTLASLRIRHLLRASWQLDMLLLAGAAVNLRNHLGLTPLALAVQHGLVASVEALLRAKADPNAVSRTSAYCTHVALTSRCNAVRWTRQRLAAQHCAESAG